MKARNQSFMFVATVTLLALLTLNGAASPSGTSPKISAVNAKVESIQKGTSKDKYKILAVEERGVSEDAPPGIQFFVNKSNGKLEAALFTVGHETWASHHWYFFDESENILKYNYESVGIPASAGIRKMASIYDGKKRIWSNFTGSEPILPAEVVTLFRSLQGARDKIYQLK
ncbi:MAG: hypothetical protein NT027_04990 [Proteobacteria bacterium]|nr:hypothetical protein [Pseudomonadota bacterium]